MNRLLTWALLALTLLTGVACKGYTGPSVRFSLGYQGLEAGITLYGRKSAAESLQEAGRTFESLLPAGGSRGKTPVPPPP